MKQKPVFIILGAGGYPYKISAASNKYYYMAKALTVENYNVLLINKYNISSNVTYKAELIDEIKYLYLSGEKKRVTTFSKIKGEILANYKLFAVLQKSRNKSGRNYLMLSYNPLILLIYYWILCKIFKYRLIISIMEDHTNLSNRFIERIKATLFWNFGFCFADAALPISNYLQNQIESKHRKLPMFKVPVLADFNYLKFEKMVKTKKYFLYCGNMGYYEVIEFVINAFNKLENNEVNLFLILHGDQDKINYLKNKMENNKRINILMNVSQKDLFRIFTDSLALLIPLRPSKQDTARFPQKIAEYLASGSPVITNNIGEIQNYFIDRINAVFAENYTVEAYYKAMLFVINNPELCRRIGINGRELGLKNFHYNSISSQLSNFLMSL